MAKYRVNFSFDIETDKPLTEITITGTEEQLIETMDTYGFDWFSRPEDVATFSLTRVVE